MPARPHKMASDIFGPPLEQQDLPKRTNPPGGKDSGIFGEPSLVQPCQRTNPPGGKTSGIFRDTMTSASQKAHPNKPKDADIFQKSEGDGKEQPRVAETPKEKTGGGKERRDVEQKSVQESKEPAPVVDDHEPRLGPRPRSHNRVIQPPGGKSSITFF
ncbi:jupiter microtubule associated homolog 2 isoform X2 [Latimeria chalumnae]|nr:PREDICTED: hematological and neurological expressed 1-like protein isoform X2 [Latimeria chalumnae]XP_005997852.1 PREDICTED: hematological and neurological expressed 1-like protein isoform X2 [Latimeria chalumnae]XP_014345003.1 PREDICTED: hematological and neurological expressed 1-like protein isoform X2 [Latimeria chalumnae]|eukprot:XP_005997851.1 PREDICTED: hematological and neurological expressed 1-like protein isoform X2 [Latimeria chalumnae]